MSPSAPERPAAREQKHFFPKPHIHTGQQILQLRSAVGIGLDLIYGMNVCGLDQKHRIGNRRASIGIVFVDDEVRPLLVLDGDFGNLAREQLHIVQHQAEELAALRKQVKELEEANRRLKEPVFACVQSGLESQ